VHTVIYKHPLIENLVFVYVDVREVEQMCLGDISIWIFFKEPARLL